MRDSYQCSPTGLVNSIQREINSDVWTAKEEKRQMQRQGQIARKRMRGPESDVEISEAKRQSIQSSPEPDDIEMQD